MNFDYTPKVRALQARVTAFMAEHIVPREDEYWEATEVNRRAGNAWIPSTLIEELKPKAQAAGLWNLFLPDSTHGAGLTNLEDAPLADFRALPREGPAPLEVSFEDMSTGEAAEWHWDFGDLLAGEARVSRERNPAHTYTAPGRYTVNLRVKGSHGEDVEEKPYYIRVGDPGGGIDAEFSRAVEAFCRGRQHLAQPGGRDREVGVGEDGHVCPSGRGSRGGRQ